MRPAFSGVVGAIQGILLVRFIGLLFLARDSNPVFELCYTLSAPLVWPWTWLDRWAGQPRFGARLELATLAAMLMVALLASLWTRYWSGRAADREDDRG